MITHGIILLIIALLELALGFNIYSRDRNNSVNKSFLALTLGVIIWVAVNAFLALTKETDLVLWYRLAYFAGVIIASSFLYFAWVFPYRLFFTDWRRKIIVIAPIILFIPLFFLTDLMILSVTKNEQVPVVDYGSWFSLYVAYFVAFFAWAFLSLVKKYRRSDGMHRWQLKYVIISALIPVVVNLFTDIFLPWFGYSRQPWMVYIGAELSVVWLGLTAYVAFKKKVI